MRAKLLQLCPPFCNPMDWSLPSSTVHGILQARILEWIAMPSFGGSSWLRDRTLCLMFPDLQLDSSPLAPHSRFWSLFVFKFLVSHFLTQCMTLYLAVLTIGTSIPSSVQWENTFNSQRDGMGREGGGGFRMGNTCIPVADSFGCLAKLIQLCKV